MNDSTFWWRSDTLQHMRIRQSTVLVGSVGQFIAFAALLVTSACCKSLSHVSAVRPPPDLVVSCLQFQKSDFATIARIELMADGAYITQRADGTHETINTGVLPPEIILAMKNAGYFQTSAPAKIDCYVDNIAAPDQYVKGRAVAYVLFGVRTEEDFERMGFPPLPQG